MKKLIVLLAIVAFVGTALTAIASDKGPASITMDKAKMGSVTFDHAKHQAAADCVACHHTGTYETCDSCHGDADDGAKVKYKTAIHNNCKDCHKEMKKGPTKCKECHVK